MNRRIALIVFALVACLLCSFSAVAQHAYVFFTSTDSTLTFYYDNQMYSRPGGLPGELNTGDNDPDWLYDNLQLGVAHVVFDPSFADARQRTMYSWFKNMTNLRTIEGWEYLNTSHVTNMAGLFYGCSKLTSVDLSHFNTAVVTNMCYMFSGCSRLTSLDLSSFNTYRVTDMSAMFEGCSGLTSLDLSNFDTSSVIYMEFMFKGCSQLSSLNLSNFDTRNVTRMESMFDNCSSLTSLDLSSFNTAKVTDMSSMFYNCSNLATVYVSNGWSTSKVSYSTDMFRNCTSIVGGMGTTYDASHVTKYYARIDGGPANPGYFTEKAGAVITNAKAYVYYTSSDSTLTFYYDNLMNSRTGGLPGELNTGDNDPDWLYDNLQLGVAHVVFDPSFADARQRTMYSWFKNMTNLRTIEGWEYLNTSHVTNMAGLFYGCSKLTSVDLSHFNTAVVTNMCYMFSGCSRLTSLDLSSFNTYRVTDMSAMFEGCSGLTSLDLSNFDTSSVIYMEYMFKKCSNLTTIYAGDGWSTSKVTYSNSMFWECTSLVGGMGTTYSSSHVDKAYAHIDGGTANPGYFTEKIPEAYACYTPSNTTLTFYYDTRRSTREGTTYDLNQGTNNPGWRVDQTNAAVTQVVFDPSFADARPITAYYWFFGMSNLNSIVGMEYLNTSEMTSMYYMFNGCSALTNLDVSHFITANVTNMAYMFYNCAALTSLDVSNFVTDNVTRMSNMFWGCRGLISLDVSNFNTTNVTELIRMFGNCTSLTSLDLSNFNTSKVTNMSNMFYNCPSLESLDVSNFNTSEIPDLYYMFYKCSSLTSLDLSSFNTAKVSAMDYMFCECTNLTTIYVGEGWTTDAVTSSSSMFRACTSIRGGQGTTYNANHMGAEYAHIDGGPSNPGYFTDINPVEAYACYTPSNTTLTFYYDSRRSTREGTTYDMNTGSNQPDWVIDQTNSSVTQVVFDPSFADARPVSTYAWIFCMADVQSITGLEYLNTSEATNMAAMFMGCESMTSLDLSHFNTVKVTDMFNMFNGCSNLTSLDVSGFNTANVIDMRGMFRNCSKLTSLDLSSFNTAMVGNMSSMFNGDSHLTTIYAGDEWTIPEVYFSSDMFYGCTSLVGGMGTTYDADHTDVEYAHIDGGPSNPGYFTAKFLRGDVNNDGSLSIADVTILIGIVLRGNTTAADCPAGDMNGDGSLSIADVTTLISRVLRGY